MTKQQEMTLTATSKKTQHAKEPVDLTAGGTVPPERYLLFPWGDYITYEIDASGMPSYETFQVDETTAQTVVEAFNAIGNDIMIDYEHANELATGPGDGGCAAGWIKGIEVVEGEGIYANPVTWTPTATKLLQDRAYRYRSPHFTYDEKTMRVVALMDDSLVNKPASVGMIPMAAKATTEPPADGGGDNNNAKDRSKNMSEALIKALSVKDEDEAIAAVTKMQAKAEKQTEEITEAKEATAKAEAALSDSDTLISTVMETVECESRDALVGTCKAHRDDAAKVADVTKKIEEIEKAAADAEKVALIDGANVNEDTRAWMSEQDLATVKSYVESCCKVAVVNTDGPQSNQAKTNTDDTKVPEWFAEVHSDKTGDALDAEWKKNRAHKKAMAGKPAADFTDDSGE